MSDVAPRQMFEKFAWLPSKTLAAYAYVAARMCLSIWENFEATNYGSQSGVELLEAYEQWSKGKLTNSELKGHCERLYALLPDNLEEEPDPSPGFAGWSILAVAQIAIEDCGEVIHSIAYTAVLYSAGAVCRSGRKMIALDIDTLGDCELQFLSQWWEKCHMLYPAISQSQ